MPSRRVARFPGPRPGHSWHRGTVSVERVARKWGCGLGSRLLGEAHEGLRRHGYRRVHLWVADGNLRAIDLYERHGWHTTGITKNDGRFTPPLLEHHLAIELG
ncbi:MAG: GNAT family N-acetyltransferase [Micrococcaceae bacterium]|nr:GNAT family N-acetyltransferase [Micrococcaceae bacterium]